MGPVAGETILPFSFFLPFQWGLLLKKRTWVHRRFSFSFKSSPYIGRAGPRSTVGSVSDSRARGPLVRYPVQPHTFVSPSADSRRAVVSYW